MSKTIDRLCRAAFTVLTQLTTDDDDEDDDDLRTIARILICVYVQSVRHACV